MTWDGSILILGDGGGAAWAGIDTAVIKTENKAKNTKTD